MDVQTPERSRTGKDSVHPPAGNVTTNSLPAAESDSTTAAIIDSSPAEGRQSLDSISSTENLVHAEDSNPGHRVHTDRAKNLSTVEEIDAKSDHVTATSDGPTKYDLIYQSIEGLDGNRETKTRRSTSCCERMRLMGDGRDKSSNGNVKISAGGRKVGKAAAGCAADCTAVCCCPCLVVHVLVLAVVKVPVVCARKALSFVKKKIVTYKKDDVEREDRSKKARSHSMAWSSLRESPVCSGPIDGSTSGGMAVDPNNVWKELYAAGHMGFAGPAIERH